MKVWLFQRNPGKKNPWSVGWYTPQGSRKEKQIGGKTHAENFRLKIQAELTKATYQEFIPKTWQEFRQEYEQQILSMLKPSTAERYASALNNFEAIAKPGKVAAVTAKVIDQFIAARSKQRGLKPGSTVSPATVNAELRVIRRVLKIAKKWKYLHEDVEIGSVKEPKKLKRFVTQEHFEAIYRNCNAAQFPNHMPYSAEQWWKALLMFCYMTGWRRSEPLALLRKDVDLKAGFAITRAEDNKAGRDEPVALHPIVIEHLQQIPGFTLEMFPWLKTERGLYREFERIQKAAGIHLPCSGEHEHTDSCHYYGFHDLRRGFATVTGARLDNRKLQQMMRHKSYSTTQRYVDMRHPMNGVLDLLDAPTGLDKCRAVSDSGT